DERLVRCQKPVRQQVERMPRVRTAVDITAHVRACAHDEAAQRPIAAADREGTRTTRVEIGQTADDSLDIEVMSGGHASSLQARARPLAAAPRLPGASENTTVSAPAGSEMRCT